MSNKSDLITKSILLVVINKPLFWGSWLPPPPSYEDVSFE